MPQNDWMFDEQGRMRADIPPVLYPNGRSNALAPQIPLAKMPAPDVMNRLSLHGWRIRPKRWKNQFGADWYGLVLTRDISI